MPKPVIFSTGGECFTVDHVEVVSLKSLNRRALNIVIAVTLLSLSGKSLAQEPKPALPTSAPLTSASENPSSEKKSFDNKRLDQVLEGLKDPNIAPLGQTLSDIGIPKAPLSLEQALRTALESHPDLKTALANIENKEFGVTASTASRYPSFSFSASAGQGWSSGQSGGMNVTRTGVQKSYGLGIGLNQDLLDFGRTHYRVKLAELSLAQTHIAYLQTRQVVINAVVQAYFEVLRGASAIEVGLANVRNAELLVEQAKGFVAAGTRAKIEVIRAEASLANAKLQLVKAQGSYGRAMASLATALGEKSLPEVMPEPITLAEPDWSLEHVRELARKARPDMLIASLSIAEADAQIRLARAEYYPRISLSASYSWNDSLFPPLNSGYNVGINLQVPILNEPMLSSAVGQAVANKKAAVSGFESLELTVVQQATEALYTMREAVGSSQAAAEGLRSAEENFRLATERYRVGVGNSLEVSDSQRVLVEARSADVQARYNLQEAIGNLLLQTGQLDKDTVLPKDLRIEPIFEVPSATEKAATPNVKPSTKLDKEPEDKTKLEPNSPVNPDPSKPEPKP